MDIRTKLTEAAGERLISGLLKYIEKDPDRNMVNILDAVEKYAGRLIPERLKPGLRRGAEDPTNVYHRYIVDLFTGLDRNVLVSMGRALGVDAAYLGTKTLRANRAKYDCNIPWLILMDPTSACNLRCTGCWAADYNKAQNLTLDEMRDVIRQCKELGTHVFMFTGGEPLIRKDDILTLCEENRDCAFLAFTNATLIDQALCDRMLKTGNLALALSIEGTKQSNDERRGEGAYDKTVGAMELLKKNRLLYGISVCYTRENDEFVTSDEFLDKMIDAGAMFAMYFNYMPVGKNATADLIPTPEQRAYMYKWIRKVRDPHTGKKIFLFDFQDDGEYVGGCIAAGRNYFHINSAGDIEPCVFIHFADANIRTDTILEALKKPLFTAYYRGQPFNDNHLRPCPMLENPHLLRKMIADTGARSTDFIAEESVDELCRKCDSFAYEWAPVADDIWNSTVHKKTTTRYYRDTH
ncbi:MAG: radical SAM protein [Clostridia bacterium]|nr:radical SAM protein [Clostridia bacterium]